METKNYHEIWNVRIQPFAEAVGKTPDEVNAVLIEITGKPADEKAATQALEVLGNKEAVTDAELIEAFKTLGIPSGVLKLNLVKLRGIPAKVEEPVATATTAVPTLAVLPDVPNEESFLGMLKIGGELKVEKTEVISAVKAGFAKKVKLFELPDLILKKMDAFLIKQQEPAGEAYFKLDKQIKQRRYGEVLSVLGVEGSYVSETRKKEFLARVDDVLWVALAGFHVQLKAWYEAWVQNANNPAMLTLMFTQMAGGGKGIPPGLTDAPDTTNIRAAAEEVVNQINKVFAGPGIPVARALAYDATRIMAILSDPNLPTQIGTANKEQMLKELGVNVGTDLVRTEQNITRYTLAVMELNKIGADTETLYLGALYQLGNSINWNNIGAGKAASGIGVTV